MVTRAPNGWLAMGSMDGDVTLLRKKRMTKQKKVLFLRRKTFISVLQNENGLRHFYVLLCMSVLDET